MNRPTGLRHARFVLAVAAMLAASGAAPARDGLSFRECRALLDVARAPGSPGNLRIEQAVAERFAASGFTNGAIVFEAPVFEPGPVTLSLPGRPAFPLHTLAPTLMRPGNFAEREFDAGLVYLGRARPEDLDRVRGIELTGSLILLDYACGDRWLSLLRFGCRGFVFLGTNAYDWIDSVGKVYNTEVAVPRFFASPADAAVLKAAAVAQPGLSAHVQAEPSRWTTGLLRDLWVVVPGRDAELKQEVVVFTAAMDAGSAVPELATGGGSAGNLALLLGMLERFRKHPPARTVLLAAVNAHTRRFQGERMLAWHLLARTEDIEQGRELINQDIRKAALYAEQYARLKLEPCALDETGLNAAMDMLWELHRRQQAVREAAYEEAMVAFETRLEAEPEAEAGRSADGMPEPVLDTALDLSGFTDADYRDALDAMIRAREAELSSFRVRFSGADTVAGLREDLEGLRALRGRDADAWRAAAESVRSVFDDEALLESWRTSLDSSTGFRLPIKGKLQEEIKRSINVLAQEMMEAGPPGTNAVALARLEERRMRRGQLTAVLTLFNKIDVGIGRSRTRYRQVARNDVQRELLREYRDRLVRKYSEWVRTGRAAMALEQANDRVRAEVAGRTVSMVIALDADWRADRLGFCSVSPQTTVQWQREFGRQSAELAARVTPSDGPSPWVDTLTYLGGRPEEYYFAMPSSPAPWFHAAEGQPALALKSVLANAGLAFSPDDTLARVDPDRWEALQAWTLRYLETLLDDPAVFSTRTVNRFAMDANKRLWSCLVGTYTMDEYSAKTTPDQEVPGSCIVLYPASGSAPVTDGDVLTADLGISDAAGRCLFRALNDTGKLAPLAYQLGPAATDVQYVIDKGRIQESQQILSDISREPSKTLPMFPSREFPIYDRADPTLVGAAPITVTMLYPKSAAMKSEPQKYGVHGVACVSPAASHPAVGPAGLYLWQRGKTFRSDRLYVITGQNRCAVSATDEDPEGIGFWDARELGPDFWGQVAVDMDRMNRHRLQEMHGVANQLAEDFLASGRAALDRMAAAIRDRDHGARLYWAARALGSEVKAYGQIRALTADMLKAIVVYMALLLPFCFFFQKLLFRFTKLEHELAAFIGFFLLTYVGFRFIHPAFALALNPEAIFIAFVLGATGVFISWVLHSRFEAEMQLLFQVGTATGPEVKYGTVGQTAMLIGVNNMKRRRVRTLLTTVTIVLVVFTMLSFSSVSKKMKPTIIRKAVDAPYAGFLYHWPGGAPMDEATAWTLEQLFAGKADVVMRRIVLPPSGDGGKTQTRFRVEREGGSTATLDLSAVMGLPMEDRDLLGTFPLVCGTYFTRPDAAEILLPAAAAEALGLHPADAGRVRIRLCGEWLTVIGFVEDERYRLRRDLSPSLPLLPLRKSEGQSTGGAAAATPEGEGDAAGVIAMDTGEVAFLPVETARRFGGRPFTVSIRLPPAAPDAPPDRLWQATGILLEVTDARFFIGSPEDFAADATGTRKTPAGVYYVGSNYRTSIGGLSRLFIPLLVAGFIVLNTMLGTVYERKSEIAVYNAVGLNPTHIFMFFLAEALVYSVIGSVGGYLVGQLLSMALKALGWVKGIDVNFSSLMVVYAILFTIGLVLLSTIYPAWVATRTAVPSGKRKWSLPDHDGHRMQVAFPFIYQQTLAPGVMAYLHEYFAAFTEQSLGDQIALLRERRSGADAAGRPVFTLVYEIALAPFDLGVTQEVVFTNRYDETVRAYRLFMTVNRRSGQDTNWASTNRPFLEKLRHVLIRWRNIDPTRHAWYVGEAGGMFGVEARRGEGTGREGEGKT